MIDCGGSDPLVLGISIMLIYLEPRKVTITTSNPPPPPQCLPLDPTPVNPWLHNIYLSPEM